MKTKFSTLQQAVEVEIKRQIALKIDAEISPRINDIGRRLAKLESELADGIAELTGTGKFAGEIAELRKRLARADDELKRRGLQYVPRNRECTPVLSSAEYNSRQILSRSSSEY